MEKKKHDKEIIELRRFLIGHFLLVLSIVAVVEYLITQLMNRLWYGGVQDYFFAGNEWKMNLSGVEIVRLILSRIFFRKNPSFIDLAAEKDAALLLVLFAFCILFLLPYALGACWYAWIASRKVYMIEERKEAMQKEYDRQRNLMLSDIAHDLRTPITTMAGYAKALSDGMVTEPEKQQEYFDAMQTKSARMNELIELLFEYVKLESAGFTLARKPMDLSELLRENAAMLYSDFEEAGMELEADIPEKQCLIYADRLQFSRVITNLMTNIIRHNEPGTKILLSMKEADGQVVVLVADSGAAIPSEVAEHLFEPFVTGDESRTQKGGSGLGLSIAHKIIKMHNWDLSLTDQVPGYTKAFRIVIS